MISKRFICKSGDNGSVVTEVTLNGVMESERLTPKMATRAARVAFGHRSGVSVFCYDDDFGYRLYANSARKLQEVTTMEIRTILYQYAPDDAGMFGADADLTDVNITASYNAYEDAALEALKAAYPTALVSVQSGPDMTWVNGESDHGEIPWIAEAVHRAWASFDWVVSK